MKNKILLLIALICFSFVANSQSTTGGKGSFRSASNSGLVDTVTDTGTKTMNATAYPGNLNQYEVSVTLANISGTSAGSAILQHSVDGTNFYSFLGDTLTFAAAGTKALRYSSGTSTYLRIKFVGTGTQSTKLSAYYKTR